MPQIQARTTEEGEQWISYLGMVEKLPDQVLFAIYTSGHNGMGRDSGQVALLIFIYWLPGVVPAEELILVPLSLVWNII